VRYDEKTEQPSYRATDERAELSGQQSRILKSILEYGKKNDLQLLFVLTPYMTNAGAGAVFNSARDMIEEYGYHAINGNDYYEEIGLYFPDDYYNGYHTNVFGAEKFTHFLGQYIIENYSVSDKRGLTEYGDWNELYKEWQIEESNCKRENLKVMQEGRPDEVINVSL